MPASSLHKSESRNRWIYPEVDENLVNALRSECGVSDLIARLLVIRGYTDADSARTFLNPKAGGLHEPFLLKDMEKALERIRRAIDAGEKILVWGDYDVDGTTGTTVLRKAIEIAGGESGYHVPHRFHEGYGVNVPELSKRRDEGYSLVVTVDCGITAFEAASWAKENGMDFIITDHHLPKESGLPDAYAVVNPNRPDCEYPDKHLAGVGVAFKLAHAILRDYGREELVPYFLKVVAIGTIADVMMLTGENRTIVARGLEDLPKTVNYGLKALMEVSECNNEMTSYHIGFRVAPRINAAGRMDAAKHVVELLETKDFARARELAGYLNRKNIERQRVQAEITERALMESADMADRNFIVLAGEGWHRGVIGLAASRIAEKLFRPVIVLSIEDGIAYGSARSVAGFHLLEALESCKEHFTQFGGHAVAAGMSLPEENIPSIASALNEYAAPIFGEGGLVPEIKIDTKVSSENLGMALVEDLKAFEPYGQGNPKPVFSTGNLELAKPPWVMKEKHLKLILQDKDGREFEAVWWDGVARSSGLEFGAGKSYEIAYVPEINTWQGNSRLQLVVSDVRESS
ncbi:MAG: single-stranded-DNA-specific exonuclease RecJ [Pyrinomonadaceae bacterium]